VNRSSALYHEHLQRSPDVMKRLAETPITVCGAGALGANIVESLTRSGGAALRVIDRDRIEERNLSTQPYFRSDVGALKATILANSLYRAVGAALDARTEELDATNAGKLLKGSALVVDTFDNSVGRQAVMDACETVSIPCLHVGLADGYAEVIWTEHYRVPSAANDNVCDYPLARNLVGLAVAVACEVVIAFVARGDRRSYTVTLDDLAVRPLARH